MPTTTAVSPLEPNLEALGSQHADLAERLRRTTPASGIVVGEEAQGVATASLDGRQLCSRRRPLDEARRLADGVDLVEHAVVVVMGFGLGYHVRRLAERYDRTGVVVVFEPDLGLVRAVLERVDHSAWLRDALVVWVTDPEDRATLARRLQGAESIIAQGVHFLEHPASTARLGDAAARFSRLFGEFVTAARTTLVTTLVRSVETVRNLLLNIDHYAAGPGIADLAGAARGFPAIVVSAGPSLHRKLAQLADPRVRERCVIIAVQTTLQPLLEAGIRPHFVTALDYHEISRRFYERLAGHAIDDVTLVAEPKAHPVILDAYPGPSRCCASGFLDRVLGDMAVDMGQLPAGATVAHLALYLARHLGCDPIVLTGQDLGFTDGLYYAPGTAIDDVWAPELNPFNTIEMMQWQRIVRHRTHLHRMTDPRGRPIFSDAQMLTYLQQFERDFAAFREEGFTIIDATEGGVPKQHVEVATLDETLRRHATRPLPVLPAPPSGLDDARRAEARRRVRALRADVESLGEVSRRTRRLVESMLADQGDPARMERHFRRLDRYRAEVERRFESFELLNQINQLGVFKRHRADRRLQLAKELDAIARQRAQLERDLVNVTWLADAAEEMLVQLDDAARVLRGEAVMPGSAPPGADTALAPDGAARVQVADARVAAIVPIDVERNGLGRRRPLDLRLGDEPVLRATLRRLGRCEGLDEIVVLAPPGLDVDGLIGPPPAGPPVVVERTAGGSPFGPGRAAVAAARAWSPTCWRGGIAGMSVYDEVLCPAAMSPVMARRGLTAALLVGADWPLVDPATCDAVVARHLEHPEQHRLVFTQAPPGLCGCVISAPLMRELAEENRLCTIGALLVYQPRAPQGDPIARAANVQLPHAVRGALVRAVADDADAARVLASALGTGDRSELDMAAVAARLTEATATDCPARPAHLILEITTRRERRGRFHDGRSARRDDLPLAAVERLAAGLGPLALTLDGAGDPVLHPEIESVVAAIRGAGVEHVHLRTELRAGIERLVRIVDAGVEVVSVDLHADRAATYRQMMGDDGFRAALEALDALVARRGAAGRAGGSGAAALALPWIVPRLQRSAATIDDLETFYDRWQHQLGAALLEPLPEAAAPDDPPLLEARTPPAAARHRRRHTMTVLSDGSVPADEEDADGRTSVGNVMDEPAETLWEKVREARGMPRRTTADR